VPKFASIDMGSNASRLRIVEADGPQELREVASLRVPVRLGHEVFLTGRLDPRIIDQAVAAVRRFAEAIDDAEVERYRAVVTASARESDDAEALVSRVRRETGIALEAIDGSEEARLVRLAVSRVIDLREKRALLMDLGGGSLEITEVAEGEPVFSTSLEIGTVRLLESFLASGKRVEPAQERLLVEYLERMLVPLAPDLARRRYDLVVGTGGNFEAIAQLASKPGAPRVIDVGRARELLGRLSRMTPKERASAHGLRPDRADVIVPALYAMLAVADHARAREVHAPGVGLKDGILYELVDKHFRVWDYRGEEDASASAAVQLGRRYHFDEAHARQVERLAVAIFDGLASLHKLGPTARRYLRLAALLHDVGDFIHFASHHKHTQYLIEHSEITGLSPTERVLVGCVARYHRRAMPSTRHESYARLDPASRVVVRKLASILRIADALDREHLGKVKDVQVAVSSGVVTLRLRGEGDIALEQWTVARKAALFEATFRRKLVVQLAPAPRAVRGRGAERTRVGSRAKPSGGAHATA
jgi:exopolyphosphatase/guanosine-5'-triphosphate,3'-diphosphate pyrophosphatase